MRPSTLIQLIVWASGHPGLLITGNIMVDKRALGEPRNVVVEDYTHFDQLKNGQMLLKELKFTFGLGSITQGDKPFHGSIRKLWPRKLHQTRSVLAFPRTQTPEEFEIWEIIKRFGIRRICKEAGFTGCQIHGAHGY